MGRTVRASLIAAVIGFVSVTGMGWFLGFAPSSAAIAGGVTALLAAGLLLAAARRAESFNTYDAPDPSALPPDDPPAGDGGVTREGPADR